LAVVKRILTHEKFTSCTAEHTRPLSHFLVFFGFVALSVVTFWVITGPINPLLQDRFVYPFSFWSPWKILANTGGVAVLAGCVLMIRDRLYHKDNAGNSTFFDWAFVWTLFAVVVSGFITEGMHYLRMVPHTPIRSSLTCSTGRSPWSLPSATDGRWRCQSPLLQRTGPVPRR
jgi:nitrate reductase gamma subunit